MEQVNEDDLYISHDHSYSEQEVAECKEIRHLPAGEEKQKRILQFQERTGKAFLFQGPIRVGFNPSAILDSREIDAGCRFIDEHRRESRKSVGGL